MTNPAYTQPKIPAAKIGGAAIAIIHPFAAAPRSASSVTGMAVPKPIIHLGIRKIERRDAYKKAAADRIELNKPATRKLKLAKNAISCTLGQWGAYQPGPGRSL